MQFNRKNNILLVSVILVTFFLLYAGLRAYERSQRVNNQDFILQIPARETVTIGDTVLSVEIADTPEKKSKGLGGRTSLADNYGMLFPFADQQYPQTFWMKGMLVSIDIIWITDNTIITIDKNVQPEPDVPDYELKRYSPDEPIDYVLEVRGGLSDEKGFEVGDPVIFNLSDSETR
ncbi:DUF192 domain-containing protein [Candidatus Roizmanbacteria bacterium]|nr:DUF192 domain-containing protein [Candidatus Roizmanbacteria bacterium]